MWGYLKLTFLLTCMLASALASYEVTMEKAEIVTRHRKLVPKADTKVFPYNNSTAINITMQFSKDLSPQAKSVVNAMVMQGGRYREFLPPMTKDFCVGIKDSPSVFACGNFQCPIKKGSYRMCNLQADTSQFPPAIPSGNYIVGLKVTDGNGPNGPIVWIHFNIYITLKSSFPFLG